MKGKGKFKTRLRQIGAVVVSAAMALSCFSATAFADNETTSSDNNGSATHVYELYQIFTGDVSTSTSEGTTSSILSNLVWGMNGTGYESGQDTQFEVSDEVINKINKANEKTTDSEKIAIIKEYVDWNSSPYKGETDQPTQTGTLYTYKGIEPGYYLIKDKTGSLDQKDGTYTLYYITSSNGTLAFDAKGTTPTVEKEIVDPVKGDVVENSASIGQEVTYKLTGRISDEIKNYNTYYYEFKDTLSKGLTFKGKDSVKVQMYTDYNDKNPIDVTKYFYIGATTYDETNGTTITISMQDLKQLENLKKSDVVEGGSEQEQLVTLGATVRFEVTYTATLNDKAVVNGSNDNKVKLVFYNDPNNSGSGKNTDKPTTPENPPTPDPNIPTGETPEKETKTYTTGIYLTKVDGDTSARLTGAEFMLTGTNVIKLYVATQTVFTPLAEDATTSEDVYYELATGAYTKIKPTEENTDAYKSTTQRYTRKTVTEVLKDAVATEGSTTTKQVVGTVDGESGVLVFTGLGAGSYTLTETKAPTGYNKMDPVEFTITYEGNGVFSSTGKGKFDSSDGLIHYVAQNYPGTALPHTGGIGTTIFYVVGSVLVLGACIALITRRRMHKATK